MEFADQGAVSTQSPGKGRDPVHCALSPLGGSGAEAKQCQPVNSSDYFSSVLVMDVSSSPISTHASLGASRGLVYSQIFWKG